MDKMGRVEVEGFVVDFEAGKFEHLSHNIWYWFQNWFQKKETRLDPDQARRFFREPHRRQKSNLEEHNLITLKPSS